MKLLLSTICVVSLGSAVLGAQNRPDFSGTWNMDLARSEEAAQGTPIKSVTVAIRQTPGEVRIETTRDGSTELARYLLSAEKPAGSQERVGLFRWDGPRLVTTLVVDINSRPITVQEIRSLSASGTEMTVEVSLAVEHGYQTGGSNVGRSQNVSNASKGTNVFVKAP